ncbi:beta-ribofuranosylaminobenzene 5'-phosphate synthase [Methanomicrobiaceae archaeon CYW5]|uniref:beta-ribofuranosylaminobenzene 5'-phosphate synthase n=1 Tax=Methanovulcanius yangii TaxID=1789227 RepID=UPI0029CA3B9B|nr:beta-ribofuranosylaminobenzene 5'-phosphate synthase [Methanovulcanius yangii]MBT8507728.1 beta-ribofuranosylaminobenzene 5'-phosphate synthase [Methanovulcanius yangii]
MASFKITSKLRELESQVGTLSPMQKILLGTDGSVTTLLENALGCEVTVNTLFQEVVPADERVASSLGIRTGEQINHRIITLNDRETGKALLYAVSDTPLSRLDPSFRDDLMQADIPIGRIMQKHHLEARRELKEVRACRADPAISGILGIFRHEPLLSRKYHIITGGKPLIAIRETFPYSNFTDESRVIVETPSRIHMGLIDMNGSAGRVDGGIGLAIEDPAIVIEAKRGSELRVWSDEQNTKNAERVKRTAEIILARLGVSEGADIMLHHSYSGHIGLGSGTQLDLATARALYGLFRPGTITVREIAALTGRGGTSGIGTAAFEAGGFIIDGGHSFGPLGDKSEFRPSSASSGIKPAPVLFRHPFPEDWQILLAIPDIPEGASGKTESDIFRTHCPVPIGDVRALCHTVLMQMLPAIIEKDLDLFGCAVNTIQEYGFKQVEHRLQPPLIQDLIAALRTTEAAGVGLSSFGPTVYAIGDNGMQDAGRCAEDVMAKTGGGRVILTRAQNRGAEIRAAP